MSDYGWGAGNPDKWRSCGTVHVGGVATPLVFGEHPHSRMDNNLYVTMERDGHSEPVAFDGHRVMVGVSLETYNYLKSSHLSGDEVRKGGVGKILADGEVVYEFFFRDIRRALLEAYRLITDLYEHPSDWLSADCREKLVGRAVWYDRTPAIIKRLVVDQGCVVMETTDGQPFPDPIWVEPGESERESVIKSTIFDPKIWWFREVSE